MMEVDQQESGNSGRNMCSTHIAKINCFLVSIIIIVFLLDTYMKSYPLVFENPKEVLEELFRIYIKQFATFNGGSKYCDPRKDINPGKILTSIRKNWIIHQEVALKDLEIALRNEYTLNSVALVGPIGVGKSLVVTSLIANFPWPDNVHTYAWNTNVRDEAEKFYMLRMIIQQFSDCGRNLLIIENLQDSDHALVPLLSELIKRTVNKHKKIIVFYVFNLSSDEYLREEQQKFLTKSLPLVNIVNFNAFTEKELKDCIYREMRVEKINLKPEDFNRITLTIDVAQSGCRNVNERVLSYGSIFNGSMTDDLCSLNLFVSVTMKYSGYNETQTESSLVNVKIVGHKYKQNHSGMLSWRTDVAVSHKSKYRYK
uniref:AAA+ ATPase domain-containing protein n=1 Tax=Glossina palpalis gambiensis TaxID=67801 RepID=A0A1B0BHG2_9MUSC